MRCNSHPDVETTLRCGKCGKPICPRCLVQTPVGTRCRECARLRKLPTFQVSAKHYLAAAGAGLGTAIATGIVWGVAGWFLAAFLSIGLNLILAPAVGYTIGNVISLSVNHRRGTGLAILAGFCVAISFLVAILFPWGLSFNPAYFLSSILNLVAVAIGVFAAVSRLR
ncbi:MAG: hypothetical protein HYX79_08790 [Chloroflexi bacterium]|nr:hypothetical protein [Chloroflexota bacterium]